MIAIIRNGVWVETVSSLDGYDVSHMEVREAPADPENWLYESGEFYPRPPTLIERDDNALESDPQWQGLIDATPEQVGAWLESNVTDLQSARRVLRFLVVALRRLYLLR